MARCSRSLFVEIDRISFAGSLGEQSELPFVDLDDDWFAAPADEAAVDHEAVRNARSADQAAGSVMNGAWPT